MRLAALQMVSTADVEDNIATACRLIAEAATRGAKLVLLPEYWAIMGMQDADKLAVAEIYGSGSIQDFMRDMARQYQVWLIGGTLPLQSTVPDKVLNSTLVYNPQGKCVARYDKMHLFSFTRGEGESYDESRSIVSGDSVGYFQTPFGRVGLSVCYDLRFPELYRALGECSLIVVPSAFTYTTGESHWEVLLRARAIENQCYVLAAAQGGSHPNGRRTWGHSMLVDPWGKVSSVLPEGEGVVSGELDLAYMHAVRENLPSLKHRRISLSLNQYRTTS